MVRAAMRFATCAVLLGTGKGLSAGDCWEHRHAAHPVDTSRQAAWIRTLKVAGRVDSLHSIIRGCKETLFLGNDSSGSTVLGIVFNEPLTGFHDTLLQPWGERPITPDHFSLLHYTEGSRIIVLGYSIQDSLDKDIGYQCLFVVQGKCFYPFRPLVEDTVGSTRVREVKPTRKCGYCRVYPGPDTCRPAEKNDARISLYNSLSFAYLDIHVIRRVLLAHPCKQPRDTAYVLKKAEHFFYQFNTGTNRFEKSPVTDITRHYTLVEGRPD